MTKFKTPLLAIALMVVTIGNLIYASSNDVDRCIFFLRRNYGNGGKRSGVENFQHSFFKKTEEIIMDKFKPPIDGESEEDSDEYEAYSDENQQPIVGDNVDEPDEFDGQSSYEYEPAETPFLIRLLGLAENDENVDEDSDDDGEGSGEDEPQIVGESVEVAVENEEYNLENELRKLKLDLVLSYFQFLYKDNEIVPYNISSRNSWCWNQASIALVLIQMDRVDISYDDFDQDKQYNICLRYVKYLGIHNDLNVEEETFEYELKKFYFETTEDMFTLENLYQKTSNVETEVDEVLTFYLKTYTMGYYEQYQTLVNNLIQQENGVFKSITNFCNFSGKDIVASHPC